MALHLPLTTADLSTFTAPREIVLFPHVAFVRGAVLGAKPESVPRTASGRTGSSGTGDSVEQDAASTSSIERFLAGMTDSASAQEAAAAKEHSVTGVAALRAIRGFYPRVKVTLPTSLTVIETAVEQAKRFPCRADVSVDARASQMKAGKLRDRSPPAWFVSCGHLSSRLGCCRSSLVGRPGPVWRSHARYSFRVPGPRTADCVSNATERMTRL